MGIAHLEQRTRLRPRLLDRFLNDFIDELGNQQTQREEHALKLAAEDEMRDKSTKTDENGDERDPCQEMTEAIASTVADVGESDGLEGRMGHDG